MEKPSGMEIMMKSLLKMMGFNPEEVKTAMQTVVTDLQEGLARVGNLLQEIKEGQSVIDARIERLEFGMREVHAKLGISNIPQIEFVEDEKVKMEDL
jgi:DNA-binding transcriptional MerR regulator